MYQKLNITLKCPTSIFISGSSNCGKTQLVCSILKQRKLIFDKTISNVVYVYTEWQQKFDELRAAIPNVVFTQDIFSVEQYCDKINYTLLILDDLFVKINSDSKLANYITEIFIAKSHHCLIIPILILHSIFSPAIRIISLNTQVFIFFKQLRDKLTYVNFAKQCYPKHPSFIIDALEDATASNSFGYIVINLNSQLDERLRCCNFILPHNDMKIYCPS